VNDAVYVPQSQSEAWASAVERGARSCVRAASGRIAAIGSCTGPWSVVSLFLASIPGARFGLPLGSDLSVQISNPLGMIRRVNGVTFGSPAPVNATLLHVTRFDAASQRFTGEPMRGFGKPLGLSAGISDPVRLAVGIREHGCGAGMGDGRSGSEEGVVGDDDLFGLDIERTQHDLYRARAAVDRDRVLAATATRERFFECLAVLAEGELTASKAGFYE